MSKYWSQEQRERQAVAIREWQPWATSTGPRTREGKAKASRNAYKGNQRLEQQRLRRILRAQQQFLSRLRDLSE